MKFHATLTLAATILLFAAAASAQNPLPESFTGIPLLPQATILSATATAQGDVATIEIPTSPAGDIVNFYKHELSTQGWLINMEMLQPDSAAFKLGFEAIPVEKIGIRK